MHDDETWTPSIIVSELSDHNIVKWGAEGRGGLLGTIQYFLDIGCGRREVVIITHQGKFVLHPANSRNDSC
jgi:hypothetical protein